MKFATIATLFAVANAQDDAAAEPLDQGADCSAEGAACAEGLCCGVATEKLAEDAEEGAEAATKTVCNDEAAPDFVDEEDPDIEYSFACGKGDAEEGAEAATKTVCNDEAASD